MGSLPLGATACAWLPVPEPHDPPPPIRLPLCRLSGLRGCPEPPRAKRCPRHCALFRVAAPFSHTTPPLFQRFSFRTAPRFGVMLQSPSAFPHPNQPTQKIKNIKMKTKPRSQLQSFLILWVICGSAVAAFTIISQSSDGMVTNKSFYDAIAKFIVWGALIAAVPVAIQGSIRKAKNKTK